MQTRTVRALITLVAILTLPSTAPADDQVKSSCPGCTHGPSISIHEWNLGFRTEPFPHNLIVANLRNGRSKRVLTIDATMSNVTPFVPITFQMYPLVNGQPVDTVQSAQIDCGGTGAITPAPAGCTTTAHWWLDLDQHPELINTPIQVTLQVGTQHTGSQDPVLAVSLSARLERK